MKKRTLFFRIGAIVILLAIAAVMMVIGRGHTVYFANHLSCTALSGSS